MDLTQLFQSGLPDQDPQDDSQESETDAIPTTLRSLLEGQLSQKSGSLVDLLGMQNPLPEHNAEEPSEKTKEQGFDLAGLLDIPLPRQALIKLLAENLNVPAGTIKNVLDTVAPARKKRAAASSQRKTTRKQTSRATKKTTRSSSSTRKKAASARTKDNSQTTSTRKKKSSTTKKSNTSTARKKSPKATKKSSSGSSSGAKRKPAAKPKRSDAEE